MRSRWLTLLLMIGAGAIAWWLFPLRNLFAAFQPLTVALSIMVAGILVRLNRGMPTIDWKSLEPDERKRITSAVRDLTREYLNILAANALLAAGFIALTAIGQSQTCAWPEVSQRLASSALAAVGALCAIRMTYVVWRDYDI